MSVVFSFAKLATPTVSSPARKAAVPALLYVVLCTVYIVFSDALAVAAATNTHQLQVISTIKGALFVALTGLLFFLISYARWKHIHDQEQIILAQAKSLLQTERKHVAAMCVATVTHDLNNLLMSLSELVDGLRGREADDIFLQAMRKDLERGIGNLFSLSKRVAAASSHVLPDKDEEVNVTPLLADLAALIRKHPDAQLCDIRVSAAATPPLLLNKALFEATVCNLLINAAQAAGPHGRAEIRLMHVGDVLVLQVHDNGPGVRPENTKDIFDPCFTTKPDGTGLGLLAVKMFAAASCADIVVDKSPLGGALFALRIPIRTRALQPAAPVDAAPVRGSPR